MNRLRTAIFCLIAIIPILSAVPVIAQQNSDGNPSGREEGRGYFMFGIHFLDIDDLNTRLTGMGYAEMPSHYFSLGGGGHSIMENGIVFGGEGHAFLSKKESAGTFKTSLDGGYGFFNLGYAIHRSGRLTVYPLLGLGGGSLKMKISNNEAPLFDEILADPARSAELSTGGFLLDLAIGIDYLIIRGDDKEGGFMFGLRTGYTFSPTNSDWEMNGNEINGGPDFGATGPYVRLMIGGGGRD